MKDILLRQMEMQDLPEVERLEGLCFSNPRTHWILADEMEHPQYRIWVAEKQGLIAGYASLRYVLDEADVNRIAVFPLFRRMGVARTLVQGMKRWCQENKMMFLSLEVRQSNRAAVALYAAEGFIHQGVRKGFYEKPKEDALVMCFNFNHT